MSRKSTSAYTNGFAACTTGGEPISANPFHPHKEARQWLDWREGWNDARTAELPISKHPLQEENERLREDLTWLLRHTSGKELRRMVGELSDTSNLDEFIRAIERARSC